MVREEEYELAILHVIEEKTCTAQEVYAGVKRLMGDRLTSHQDYNQDRGGEELWQNEVRQAKRNLIAKKQVDGSRWDLGYY